MRNLSYENEFCMLFHFHANQSHFHKNGFKLRLALKQRSINFLAIPCMMWKTDQIKSYFNIQVLFYSIILKSLKFNWKALLRQKRVTYVDQTFYLCFIFLCSLTKGRPSDGFFLNMEDLIRQAIRDFDYPECTIFKQLVQTIAPVEKVSMLNCS